MNTPITTVPCKVCHETGDGAHPYEACPACRGRGRTPTPKERLLDLASDKARMDQLLRSAALAICRIGSGCGVGMRCVVVDLSDGRKLSLTYEVHANGQPEPQA